VKIQRVQNEAPKVKTFFFDDELCSSAKPGQFVMVWIPGVDEIPLSLSSSWDKLSSVTVKEVGEATQALNKMKEGDLIGVRGPFGNHFKIHGKEALVVGGGTGTAPLMMLTMNLLEAKVKTTVIEGAKTRDEILFFNQLSSLSTETDVEVFFTTDDGGYGIKGLATDIVEKVLSSKKFDVIYACGTEAMILKVYSLAMKYNIPMQASLERIMLCAMGICGSCVIGKYRVCKDGPVFDQKQLKEVEDELGKFKRDFTGERVPI
jgi:dihydroorotate dehydrogenase electron transfer subunit